MNFMAKGFLVRQMQNMVSEDRFGGPEYVSKKYVAAGLAPNRYAAAPSMKSKLTTTKIYPPTFGETLMKNIPALLLILLMGCGLANERYMTRTFPLNSNVDATVGGVMIAWEYGQKNNVYGWKFDGLRKSLVYGGIAGNVIKVSYRELYVDTRSGSVARQPFYQELQYDLSQSKQITFQDIRLEVLDANSERIQFKVTQPPAGFENAGLEAR